MATDPTQEEEPIPNLPVVPVRGVTHADAYSLYQRYNIEFLPPSYAELKLCEVVVALEEMVMDFTRAEQSRRNKQQ
jgi:hypothetical protein